MRGFLFLVIFSLAQLAGATYEPAQELSRLLENYELSPTFQIWHERKDELETAGFEIWKANKDKKDFCEELKAVPGEYMGTLKAWNSIAPSSCLEIGSAIRIFEQNKSPFLSSLSLEPCDRTRSQEGLLGPTREVILDTAGGPRLVRGDLRKCEVAFTFDDGPHPEHSLKLLKILESQNVRANFFSVGRNVDRYSNIINRVAASGHIVGNHSYSHKNFPKLKYSQARDEIINGFKSLLKIWDFTTPFFRFPYGAFTGKTRQFNQSHDIAEFFWNMDTLDWKLKKPNDLFKNVIREINREKRGILLFHDVHPQTIAVMPDVLLVLKKAGYTTAVFLPEDLIEDDFPN